MAIDYIDANGVRQIFSDIKSNLDSINNTAVSAYNRANEAYSIASEGSITPGTQTFNIAGNKTFNITNGYFNIQTNGTKSYLVLSRRNSRYSSTITLSEDGSINLSTYGVNGSSYLNVTDKGILIYDRKGYSGYINVANCI